MKRLIKINIIVLNHNDIPQTFLFTRTNKPAAKFQLDSPRLTKTHQDSPRLTKTHQDSPRLTKSCSRSISYYLLE